MATSAFRALRSVVFFTYGLYNLFLYGAIAIAKGTFFKRPTEQEKLELQLARDRLWNLSRESFGLSHRFLTLRSGFKFHYLCNDVASNPTATGSDKPLVIFIHGFPDSWALWRHVLKSPSLRDSAHIAAIDLPGYGGSDSMERYSATNLLEALTEFIIAIRAKYGIDDDTNNRRKTIIVAHDWGCLLSMRLAAEAPQLADRFILTNAPVPGLVSSNIRRLLSSSLKMLKTSLRSPLRSRSTLFKAVTTLKPILHQLVLSGYIFVMQLPMILVRYLGTGGNYSFLKAIHKMSVGNAEFTLQDAAECMASTLGPSFQEAKTKTADDEEYPASVRHERVYANFEHMASYYRHGASTSPWRKSIETVANLHSISRGNELRRTSTGAGVFDDGPEGVLKANSTIVWGKEDTALEPHLCLDGISDYLVHNSQVIMLPRSGHFTPIERESRVALEKVVEWAIKGEREDIGAVMQACYPKAVVTVRK